MVQRWLRLLAMLLTGPDYITWDLWYFGDFRKIFLLNIDEDQKKVLPSEHDAPGTLLYGKSAPGYCITFIKRLNEGLR